MTQPQPTPAAGGRGPIGQPRNPTTVALLSLVTCGIYALYWAYLTFEELKQHNGEGLGGGLGALLSWLVAGWFLVIELAMDCSSIVLPVRGGETIRPRWPLPIGVSRSITRPE